MKYVIVIEETRTPVGSYTNHTTAKRRGYTIRLFHYPDGAMIFESEPAKGEAPPGYIGGDQPGAVGDAPLLVRALGLIEFQEEHE